MSHLATRLPSRLDGTPLRLARAIREDVAEAMAARLRMPDQAEPSHSASSWDAQELARTCALRALDEHVAELVADGEAAPCPADERAAVDLVVAMLLGLGVLQLFVEDPSVENIDVNGADRAFVTYSDGHKELIGPVAASDDELVAMIRTAAARFGLAERRFDHAQPELDLRLPDGSRLSAVMAVTEHPVLDIRRHRFTDLDLTDLVALGMLGDDLAALLGAAVRAKKNILVSGAMNAGKTTLLRALAAEIPPAERIVTIEQALELGLDRQPQRHPDCVAMEARLANSEGLGAIGLAQLVRRSLRMNASRVIVGEVLGDEVVPMLNAMSQGRSGSMGTIHADSSAGVFRRIAAYAVQAPERLPIEATNLLIAGAVHFVVHIELRERFGQTPSEVELPPAPVAAGVPFEAALPARRITSVREVIDADGALVVSNEVFRARPGGSAEPAAPLRDETADLLASYGYDARRPERPGGLDW